MNTTRHITSRAGLLLAAASVAALLAGCGSGKGPNTTAGGSTPSQNIVSDAYRYSACMRGHGVPSFPDPHVVANTPGHQAIGIQPLPQSIAGSSQFKAAQETCKGIMPEGKNLGAKEQAEQQREHQRNGLAFAQCLRSHGVPGFPDPTAQGQLTPEMVRAAGVDLQAPSFLTAAQACVAVTHGAITMAQVEQAIHHLGGESGGAHGGPASGSSGEGQ